MAGNCTSYWFEFDRSNPLSYSLGLQMGCGVTAYHYDHAISMLQDKLFKENEIPPIVNVIENVSLSQLEQNHVVPNAFPPAFFGIWYPMGYWNI